MLSKHFVRVPLQRFVYITALLFALAVTYWIFSSDAPSTTHSLFRGRYLIILGTQFYDHPTNKTLTLSQKLSSPNKGKHQMKRFPPWNYQKWKGECLSVLNDGSECSKSIKERQKDPSTWHAAKFTQNELIDLSNLLLIVQYNEPFYITASRIYALYESIFANVVFCGPEDNSSAFWPLSEDIRNNPNYKVYSLPPSVHFFAYGKPKVRAYSENGYYCINLALGDDPKALDRYDGVMLAADDLIMNFWQWSRSGRALEKNWLMANQPSNEALIFDIDSLQICHGNSTNNRVACNRNDGRLNDWTLWYRMADVNFYSELQRLSTSGDPFWQAALNNLTLTSGGQHRLFVSYADLFYVTKSYLPIVLPIFHLMNKHRVFIEIAVKTALRIATASTPGDLQPIDSTGHDWGAGTLRQSNVMDAYNSTHQLVHPVKWSMTFQSWPQPPISANDRKNLYLDMVGTNSGNYRKNDKSITCLYCYLWNMTDVYSSDFQQHLRGNK